MGFSGKIKKASLAGAFFVVATCSSWVSAACLAPGATTRVEVERVVDGDTLRLRDGRRLRLIGINAPELRPRGGTAEPFAEKARQRLDQWVAAEGGRIAFYPARPQRDGYGRLLVHLFDGQGRNLEARLLEEGLGYFVAFTPASPLAACQRAAELSARERRQGLWARQQVGAAGVLDRSGFALLKGRITQVQRNAGGVWLDVEGGLVLRIEPDRLRAFDALLGEALVGRLVEVRGWVVERRQAPARASRQRWMLSLSDPLMLQLLD